MILTSCTPALGMLTMPLVSLSKPVGPNMLMNLFKNLQGVPFFQKVGLSALSFSVSRLRSKEQKKDIASIPNAGEQS